MDILLFSLCSNVLHLCELNNLTKSVSRLGKINIILSYLNSIIKKKSIFF